MLSIEECKEVLKNHNLSDEEIDKIRKELDTLVNFVLDKFVEDNRTKQKQIYEGNHLLPGQLARPS